MSNKKSSQNIASDAQYLLEKASLLLKNAKTEKKKPIVCKRDSCNNKPVYKSLCQEHLDEERNAKEAAAVGKRWISTNGYEYIYAEGMKPVLYHRFRMEQILGRSLEKHETVGHIDGNKINNEDSNLVLTLKSGFSLALLQCKNCGEPYL